MIASTGQSWTQVRDEWDLPRLRAWTAYAADHPPLHIMVAQYLGIKPRPTVEQAEQGNDAAAGFLLSLPELAKK